MTITIHCSGCNAALGVPDTAAGSRARCPKCGTILTVPAPGPVPPPPAGASVPTPPKSAASPPAVAKEPEADNPFAGVGSNGGNAFVDGDGGAEEPFAEVGAEKSVLACPKGRARRGSLLGWQFFVTVGGAAACSWMSAVVVISWGMGLGALIGSLVGSMAGSLCLGICGAFFGAVLWLRANQVARATKKFAGAVSGKPSDRKLAVGLKPLVALMFAGFLLTAPFGALGGAVGGTSMTEKPQNAKKKTAKERQADDQRLWYAVFAAGGGAILGAAPGAFLCVLFRVLPIGEEKREQAKRL